MKLVIEEPESSALERRLAGLIVATSAIALVEVVRAAKVANPSAATVETARKLIASCLLVTVNYAILHAASQLASGSVRSLDAIHLASAISVRPDELVAYDRRLLAAAAEHGLAVASPGAGDPATG